MSSPFICRSCVKWCFRCLRKDVTAISLCCCIKSRLTTQTDVVKPCNESESSALILPGAAVKPEIVRPHKNDKLSALMGQMKVCPDDGALV